MKTFIILFVCIAATFADLTFEENFDDCATISESERQALVHQVANRCVNNPMQSDLAGITKQCQSKAAALINSEIDKALKCISNIYGEEFAQNIRDHIDNTVLEQIQEDIKQAISECMKQSGNDAIECLETPISDGIQRALNLIYSAEELYIQQHDYMEN